MRSSLRTSVRTSVRTNQFGHRLTKSRSQWIRKLRSKLDDGTIDPLLWGMHFRLTETYVQCRDCADFEIGVCEGGQDPIECFEDSTRIAKERGAKVTFGLFVPGRDSPIEFVRDGHGRWRRDRSDPSVDSSECTYDGRPDSIRSLVRRKSR